MLKRILTITIVLAVVAGIAFVVIKNFGAASPAGDTKYRIAAVETGTVKKTVSATGLLTPWKTVDIKSRAGGRVIKLPVEEGTILKKDDIIALIDPSDTLLTYNSAKADIESNHARVDETTRTMQLQRRQSAISIDTQKASLEASTAAANSAKARYDSSKSQADVQASLTQSAIDNSKATLDAEKEKLSQLKSATQPQAVALAKASLIQADANLLNAQAQLTRQKQLLKDGFVAQSQVDTAQASYDVARANVLSTREKINTIEPEQSADIRAQEARVNQANASLKTAEANRVQIELKKQDAASAKAQYNQALAEVKQSKARLAEAEAEKMNNGIRETQIAQAKAAGARTEASLRNADIQLKETQVKCPGDYIVLKKYVEQGTLITSGISFNSSGTSIVQLGDISRMYVDVQVDETDVANVLPDQKVDINFDAYPNKPVEGKVIKVQPNAVIDQNVTTVHVRVEVDNSDVVFKLLKPGMNATCEFIVEKKDDVVKVPNEALHAESDGSHYVDTILGGKQAPPDKDEEADPNLLIKVKIVKRPVEISLEGNDSTEIKDGVKPGEKIITQTIEPSAATPASGNPFRGSGPGPGRR